MNPTSEPRITDRVLGFVKDSQNSPFVSLLILVGAIGGVKDFLGLLLPGDYAVYILTAIVSVLAVKWIARQRRIARLPPIPLEQGVFRPFAQEGSTSKNFWPREQECATLLQMISSSENKHLIVVGRSGAGKSTLLSASVKPKLSNCHVILIDDYEGIIDKIAIGAGSVATDGSDLSLDKRVNLVSVQRSIRAAIGGGRCTWGDAFDPTITIHSAEAIAREVADFIEHSARAKMLVFVFDQFERISSSMRNEMSKVSRTEGAFEVLVFRRLISLLRSLNNTRTIFLARSDALYHTVEFLNADALDQGDPHKNSGVLANTIEIFMCPGVNIVTSADAVSEVDKLFSQVDSSKLLSYEFQAFTGIRSAQLSNTFLIQLTGYLVEQFGSTDPRIGRMLRESEESTAALRYYFEYLLNDYRRTGASEDDVELFKTIVFAIAAENRTSGRAIDADSISLISHIPVGNVRSALEFLLAKGIVVEQGMKFRMIHDMVSDYVIDQEQFAVNSRMRDGIEGLVVAERTPAKLTRNPYFPNLIGDLFRRPSFGQISILMFYCFGLVQIASPSLSTQICAVTALDRIWGAVPCTEAMPYYWAIFLMHGAWLSYIYTIQRGYLLRCGLPSWLRALAISLPIVGGWGAILFSRAPILALVPVNVVGITLAVILMSGSMSGAYIGRAAAENFRWGMRTFFNMLFSASLMIITAAIFFEAKGYGSFWAALSTGVFPVDERMYSFSPNSIKTGWVIFMSTAMIYFWLHIKPEQQSDISLAARLAIFDRTRLERGLVSGDAFDRREASSV